jgi:hypothetical protein
MAGVGMRARAGYIYIRWGRRPRLAKFSNFLACSTTACIYSDGHIAATTWLCAGTSLCVSALPGCVPLVAFPQCTSCAQHLVHWWCLPGLQG